MYSFQINIMSLKSNSLSFYEHICILEGKDELFPKTFKKLV